MKIVHITSAHPALDIRIFYKECLALMKEGHSVHLVAPESTSNLHHNIMIHALNSKIPLSRFKRLYHIYKLAHSINAEVYHFHDPEFIPFALLLKFKKIPVIYDVHEDTPRESFSFNKHSKIKRWLKFYRWIILEKICKWFLNGFVCATPQIANNFPITKTIVVRNYVEPAEFIDNQILSFNQRENTALYVGGIMRIRGLKEMLAAVSGIPTKYDAKLKLIGTFYPANLTEEAKQLQGWEKTLNCGWLGRAEIIKHFHLAKIGLVLLHPETNFKEALPIKLFEYMAAGLPVIVSDFPLWREIVMSAGCGFVVNPFEIESITEKMQYLFENHEAAEEMGRRGQQAAAAYYNWQTESDSLIHFYKRFAHG
jgi:glycosyltransferase involved in cell wall biosynthesis